MSIIINIFAAFRTLNQQLINLFSQFPRPISAEGKRLVISSQNRLLKPPKFYGCFEG